MARMATRDRAALRAMNSDVRIGRSGPMIPGPPRGPPARRSRKKIAIGARIEPKTPSGSRRKILSSSQVSFQRPLSITCSAPDRMAGQAQEDVLERRRLGTKIRDRQAVLGD